MCASYVKEFVKNIDLKVHLIIRSHRPGKKSGLESMSKIGLKNNICEKPENLHIHGFGIKGDNINNNVY